MGTQIREQGGAWRIQLAQNWWYSMLGFLRSSLCNIVQEFVDSIRFLNVRHALMQVVILGLIATSALMLWKGMMCLTGSESPVVVVLSGSMEPAFRRGDALFLNMGDAPIQLGEIIVFHVDGEDIPIVHRVIKVHQQNGTGEVDVLTKGDNNDVDDYKGDIYADGQRWVKEHHVTGRVVWLFPYVGWVTIILTESPFIKYIVMGVLGLLAITSKD
eukprot:c23287_g1_i1 orf=298-942(-)